MLDIINGVKAADGDERSDSLEDIANGYAHLVRCNPETDLIFAEINNTAIGYGRTWWGEDARTGEYLYNHFVFLKPAWRGKGIGRAMAGYLMERGQKTAQAEHPADAPKAYQVWLNDKQTWAHELYGALGFEAIRNGFEMTRDLTEPIEDRELPAGFEIRPVLEEHIPLIWEADIAAFRDHWGFVEPTEEQANYAERRTNSAWNPSLWKVAWHGDQMAGMVGNFVNQAENEEYERKRGYTEDIFVTKAFRKRGLASYLITESMKMFRDMGYEEAALGVDAENLTGALNVYKNLGYRVVRTSTTYRKPMR
jgi:GNAT superfamily N-acetyltransferase